MGKVVLRPVVTIQRRSEPVKQAALLAGELARAADRLVVLLAPQIHQVEARELARHQGIVRWFTGMPGQELLVPSWVGETSAVLDAQLGHPLLDGEIARRREVPRRLAEGDTSGAREGLFFL